MKEKYQHWIAMLISAAIAVIGARYGIPVAQSQGTPPPLGPATPNSTDLPATDPVQSIGKLALQGGYCSATCIGPKSVDGTYILVSASHCFQRVGETAQFVPRSGQSVVATVTAINRDADIAILQTARVDGRLEWIQVAESSPSVGTEIFHAGFGVHIPGNVERGSLVAMANAKGQLQYRLSVSKGDSGGGIAMTKEGKLLSPVCCTDALNQLGNVWGGSPEKIRDMILHKSDYLDLPPREMPMRKPEPIDP